MRITIGSDHRGVQVKAKLIQMLTANGHEVADAGAHEGQAVDYPDIASVVGRTVASGAAERGILICGTGIGMAIAANKIPHVRATTCYDEVSAEMCRRHNDVNVLCLSGDMLGEKRMDRLVEIWLTTEFEGGRHARRLEKIASLESNFGSGSADAGS
ncbi:MAG: ribose 5-phosphate isomerase B [Planctomycetota bacterium]